ncbi:MAG: P1 family peptidase [Candidatus Fermentithermobacillus carboniphilus]|uniref:P1 family peptidase n=1 Tax=Candidatus Fermentithermobacillus carboniphilus TaxID=3085328 RepID=A0AAT9LAE7_9FIRM|nr:MAG: P1 family peptidase [Candidatus Fermentithermobacillus carboniphilus]
MKSHARGSITDVPGIKVGNSQDLSGITGFTVVLCEEGATAGVEVMGGAPGTRETDLLRPPYTVEKVHAVFLSGGSAFGLNAAEGVVRYLEEKGAGFDTGVAKVPIVAGAVIFDLGIGDPKCRPTPDMAYQACLDSSSGKLRSGNVGAGTGATVGKLFGPDYAMKSGLGNSSVKTPGGFTVGCIAAVNAVGDVYVPFTGEIVAGAFDRQRRRFLAELYGEPEAYLGALGFSRLLESQGKCRPEGTNTTVGVVATDAPLTKAECARVAIMAMGGLAQTVRPSFTPFDGDTFFIMATGKKSDGVPEKAGGIRQALVSEIGMAAQRAVVLAILDAVVSADSLAGFPGARQLRTQDDLEQTLSKLWVTG